MDEGKLELSLRKMRYLKDIYRQDYHLGLVTDSELNRMLSDLYTMFDDALYDLHLRRVRPFTNRNMQRYADDYGSWAGGRTPDSETGDPWLMRVSEDYKSLMGTTAVERAAYFLLASEAFYEVYTYELPPDDMERPSRYAHTYGDGSRYTVLFDCVDDEGLASCEDPRGMRFTLTDVNGLHATIEVDARAGYEYRPNWEKGSQYHGLISVEGYTVPGLHSSGTVDIDNGKVTRVSYSNSIWLRSYDEHAKDICTPEEYKTALDARKTDDAYFTIDTKQGERNEEAYRNFSRWQAYFEWVRDHPRRLHSPSQEEYISELLGESYCDE